MRHYENAERTLVRALDCCAQRQAVENALERVRRFRAEAEREAAEIERQKELRAQAKVFHMPWLELALVGAGVALLFQLFPSWWEAVSALLAEHVQLLLIVANVVVLVALVVWRNKKEK
jgi:hypothetical protein